MQKQMTKKELGERIDALEEAMRRVGLSSDPIMRILNEKSDEQLTLGERVLLKEHAHALADYLAAQD